jgi:hypothetical protein
MPKKHRGATPVKAAEPEKLALPLYIRKELAKMKAAGTWDGDPFSPLLDPAVTLSIIMVDDRNDTALRAACAKSLIPFIHEDRSLAFKANASDAGGTVMVLVKRFSEGDSTPKGLVSETPPPADDWGTPSPPNPARIEARNGAGAAIYSVPDAPNARPVHTGDAINAYFEVEKDALTGVERLIKVDHTNRTFIPGAPDVIVKKDWDLN